jgi:hypothetical protein
MRPNRALAVSRLAGPLIPRRGARRLRTVYHVALAVRQMAAGAAPAITVGSDEIGERQEREFPPRR